MKTKRPEDVAREQTKWFTVKPQASKKHRLEGAPHWTHAGTIAARRQALDDLHTNRQWNDELKAHRLSDRVENLNSELHRLHSMGDMRRPGMQFYADRRTDLTQQYNRGMANIRALRQRPGVVR